jgi:flagellar protein FlaI
MTKLKKVRIKIRLGKHEQVTVPPPQPKSVPRGFKILEKYPLYEPFAHVAIAQNPKTGEYKYVLDELQLDPLERGVYNRILEILLAEIESPKEEIADPRKFFAQEAKKIVDKYRISLGWLPDV